MRKIASFEADRRAAWTVAEIEADQDWIYRIDDSESTEMLAAIRRGHVRGKPPRLGRSPGPSERCEMGVV